jgi:DNA topoisomerase-1
MWPTGLRQLKTRNKPILPVVTDPVHSAHAAGLSYISDETPGIRRVRRGRGFSYIGLDGKPIHDPETLTRIRALAIPPAWTEVWICPDPAGHLQATGRDAKGRKQYRYHAQWGEQRSQTKFTRMLLFSHALPEIRAQVARDMARRGLPCEKVLGTVVRLLEMTYIRVGNKEYARENKSFGLTTLRDRHVEVRDSMLRFHFRGKSGQKHDIQVRDRRLARIVKQCRDLPGYQLFQYIDEDGDHQGVSSDDVNDYLRGITGLDFTAKDFRTWGGTLMAARTLHEMGPATSQREARKNVVSAIRQVASLLGNRPATCRKYYVHPAVVDAYLDGSLFAVFDRVARGVIVDAPHDLDLEEAAVLALLRERGTDEAYGAPSANGGGSKE